MDESNPARGDQEQSDSQPTRVLDSETQVGIVWLSHSFILGGIVLVALALPIGDAKGDPLFGVTWEFIAGELVIIFGCLTLLVDNKVLRQLTAWWWTGLELLVSRKEAAGAGEVIAVNDGGQESTGLDRVRRAGLVIACVFVPLTFLLNATGGPVKSPFAQMVLAFAIFTPFVANENGTKIAVLVLSIAYYAGVVGFMHAWPDSGADRWAFFSVNAIFVAVGVLIAIIDKANSLGPLSPRPKADVVASGEGATEVSL